MSAYDPVRTRMGVAAALAGLAAFVATLPDDVDESLTDAAVDEVGDLVELLDAFARGLAGHQHREATVYAETNGAVSQLDPAPAPVVVARHAVALWRDVERVMACDRLAAAGG